MAASTESPSSSHPVVAVTSWRRRGKVWGDWEREIVGVEAFYIDVVQRAGLLPVMVPVASESAADSLLETVQGLVVIGGEDLHASVSGVDPALVGANASAERDRWEMHLLSRALDRGLPVLAICRGMQLLNVLRGGSLHGDVADSSEVHPLAPADMDVALTYRHEVSLVPDSVLGRIYGTDRRMVNSLHHQGVDRLGEGLVVTATAADGMVEAVELVDGPWCAAMQWHPELLADDPAEKALLREFADRCGG